MRRRFRSWPSGRPALAATIVAAAVGVAALHPGAGQEPEPSSTRASLQLDGATPMSVAETLADTTVLALAVDTRAAGGALLAFGSGRSCSCRVVFRSSDQGATWQQVRWPDGQTYDLEAALSSAGARGLAGSPCQVAGGGVRCPSGPVVGLSASDQTDPGWETGAGSVLLYVIPSGGIRCSADRGVTWATSCPAHR